MLVISSRISGWRVTDSITLPKMYPTPMPGPIVPRPAPTPSAIDLIAFAVSWLPPAWARRLVMVDMGSPLVAFGGGRTAEVDGCERCKDERLQGRDQHDLEQEERHGDNR